MERVEDAQPTPEATGQDQLITQMVESTSAYDRMTLQVEKTAADLRQLVSKGDFKCMAEICATNQRAAAAESELAALRATLRMQSGGNWLQYPVPPQHCAAWALEARGAAGPELHAYSLEQALKRYQDELDSGERNRAMLNVRILNQAAEIRRLQQSLAIAQEQSLMEMLQPLQGDQLLSEGSDSVEIDLKALLESKEWSSEDWEKVEDASVHWLNRLHTILSSCANGVQLITKDRHKLRELEQTAASTLAQQAESACSHLQEIHQQQVISMREAAEAAQRVAQVEQELQQQRRQVSDVTAARDVLEQAQAATIRKLNIAELRASEAEASCSQLCSQLQCLASGQRTSVAEQKLGSAASDCATVHAGVSTPCQAGKEQGCLRFPVDEAGLHEDKFFVVTSEQSCNIQENCEQPSEQVAPQLTHVKLQCAGEIGRSENKEPATDAASSADNSLVTLPRTQSLQEEAQSLHEAAQAHAWTEQGAIAAVHTSLRRLASATDSIQSDFISGARATEDSARADIVHGMGGENAGVGNVEEQFQAVTQLVAVCSAALQRALDARQAHNDALARAHAVDHATLTANASELALECSKAVQYANTVSAEKQAMADKLIATEGALESTEELVLDLQMRLGRTEEQCQQHKAAADSSAALSLTTQKMLLVAEERAAQAESHTARCQEKAAKSSKAALLTHIRGDDAEQALETEDCAGAIGTLYPQGSDRNVTADTRSAMRACATPAPLKGSTPTAETEKGLHWAVARVAKLMGTNGAGTHALSQDAILMIEGLQSHVMHIENIRSLAEDVIVRAKERILAHSREQRLEIPVLVAERNSVAVEDVASMLDKVLITSSNNADEVCDLQDALNTATSNAATLREELASLSCQSHSAAEQAAAAQMQTEAELQSVQQALENAKEDAATAGATLVTLQQMHEEHVNASINTQEDLMQQVKVLQQSLLLSEAKGDALSTELGMLLQQQANEGNQGVRQSQEEAEEEIKRLHTDLEHAEEREDGLLLQVHTLEQTVQDLSAAMDTVQAAAPGEDVTVSDPDLKTKLHSVEQHLGQLAAQLAEAESSVRLSDATARDAQSRAEQLDKELREARTAITQLKSTSAARVQGPVHEPSIALNPALLGRNSVLQGAIADHGNMHAETAADVVGDAVSTAARSTSDVMEGHESSQEESTERTYSPASDWQSESSLRAEELRQALDRTTAAESKAAVLQQERDQQQGELMQLMEDIGTLQSQLDALQTEKIEQEDGTDPVLGQQDEVAQLRAEIKELQDTVASANKDLTVAEAHAHEMQESLQEHERSKETMMEQLTQKLLTLQQAQETLESDFREIRTERDQALADLQLLAEHCGNILEERSALEPNAKWAQQGAALEHTMPGNADQSELIKAER